MRRMARDYGHEVMVAFGSDSISGRSMSLRLPQGRFDTWTHSGCGCMEFSTGEKQRVGKSQNGANQNRRETREHSSSSAQSEIHRELWDIDDSASASR